MQTLLEYLKSEKRYKNDRYGDDVKRIVEVFQKRNIILSYEEARNLWDSYSDYCCACWMGLPEDDDGLFNTIIDYVKENWELGILDI